MKQAHKKLEREILQGELDAQKTLFLHHEERKVMMKQINQLKSELETQREDMESEHASKVARLKKSLQNAQDDVEEVSTGLLIL